MLFLLDVSRWFYGKITKKQPVEKSEKPVTGARTGKGITDFTNQYCLTGEEHFEALKEVFGAGNIEWISKDTLSYAD